MSFGGGGGVGGAEETLAYMIKAYDMATPVFRAFGAGVEQVTKQVQATLTEMDRALAAQGKAMSTAAAEQDAALAKVKKAQGSTAAGGRAAADSQVKSAQRVTAAVDAEALATQRAADKQVAAAARSTAAFGTAESSISRMGGKILLSTVAIGAGSIDMAAKFQANTLRMRTQAGATAQGLDQIRQGLLKMAGQVGATPDQLANGMYHVVSSMNAVLPASTRVSQELKIMKIAAEGAQIGHSHLEDTTYALSAAMNALHLQANSAGRVMGQLNAIVGAGDMTMQDLIQAFKSGLIPAAQTFGISLQSVGSALAVMGDMGMRGALAGTRLRMAISLLAAPTKQAAGILETLGMSSDKALASTQRMSDLLKKAGINVTVLSDDLRKPDGLQVALSDLNNHLKSNGLSADAAGAAIDRAFGGGRMGATIKLMAENTDRLKLKFDQIGVSGSQFGHDWQLTVNTFRLQVDKALASLEAFGIGLGMKLIPYATTALHDLSDMANWFTKNKLALDLLAGSVITFASVAVGSYLIGKLRNAISLMKDFGSGIMQAGRWMFGMSAPGAGPASGFGSFGAGATGGGGLWGVTGTQIRVGTMMNPMAVTLSGAGLATGAQSATQAELQKAGGVGPAVTSAESAAMKEQSAAMTAQMSMMEENAAKQMSLMEATAMNMEAGMAKAGEQLSLGAVATGPTAAAAAPAMATVDTGAAAAGGLSFAGVKGAVSEGLTTLMRGGALAGIGTLGSQLVGHAVGGTAGSDISRIGTTASIGAGIGMAIPVPVVGPIIGAIVGGLAGALSLALHTKSFGDQIASTITRGGIGGPQGSRQLQTFQSTIASDLNAYNKALKGIPGAGASALGPTVTNLQLQGAPTALLDKLPAAAAKGKAALEDLAREYPRFAQSILAVVAPGTKDLGAAASAARRGGLDIAKQLEAGWNQYKFQNEPLMFTQLKAQLKNMPAPFRASAAESAIAFTQKLVSEGKLSKHAADDMLAQIETAFPGLTLYMGKSAKEAIAAFNINFALDKTEKDMKATFDKMRGDFPTVTDAFDKTKGDIEQKTGAVIKALQALHPTSAAQANLIARDLASVRGTFEVTSKDAGKSLKTIDTAAQASGVLIPRVLGKGSQAAQQSMAASFEQAVKDIQVSMAKGVVSTSQGIAEINKLMAKALNALGVPVTAKDVSMIGLDQAQALVSSAQSGSTGSLSGGHFFAGGKVDTPMYRVGEEAPTHPEYVLATNPAYRSRNLGLWAAAGRELDVPGFATGGLGSPGKRADTSGSPGGSYVFPFPKSESFSWQRIDQGQDLEGPPGGPVLAIGPGNVSVQSDAFSGFGPHYPVLALSAGPWAGRSVYYGHSWDTITGPVTTGEIIGKTQSRADEWTQAPAGWLEFGFTTALGAGIHGQGAEVAPMLHALAAGHMVSGTGGLGAVWNNIAVPKWTGPDGMIGAMGKAVLKKVTDAANKFGQAKAASMGGVGSVAGLNGPVEHQVFQYFTRLGYDKIAIAGMLGNAYQESSMDPSAAGGGLWQYISKYGNGAPPLAQQLQDVGAAISPYKGALNAARSPAEAATLFMNDFERPGIPALSNRIAAANQAFAQGYAQGGVPGFCGGGMMGGGATGQKSHFPFPQLTSRPYDYPLHQARDAASSYWGTSALPSGIQIAFDDPKGQGVDYGGVKGGTPWGWVDHGSNVVHINEGIWGSPSQQAADFPDFCGLMVHEYGHLAGHWDSASTPPTSITYPIIGPQNRAVAPCVQHYKDFGKPMKHAGAFGGGGMVTAHEPTTAVFGDRGAETAIFIPHNNTGGVMHGGRSTSSHSSTGAHSQSTTSTAVVGGQDITTTQRTSTSAKGVTTTSVSVSSHPVSKAAVHTHPGFNPFTDRVETHVSADWAWIHAEWAKQQHDAAAAKKKFDAFMAQTVTDTLRVGKLKAGDIQLSRKELGKLGLPEGHALSLTSDFAHVSDAGFKKVQSALRAQLRIDSLSQAMGLAGGEMRGLEHTRGAFGVQHALEEKLGEVSSKSDRAVAQRDKLFKEAQAAHGARHKQLMQEWSKAATRAEGYRSEIQKLHGEINKLGDKIATSRQAQIENQIITAAAKGIASAFNIQSSRFSASQDTLKLISGLPAGDSLNLSKLQLQSLGISRSQLHNIEGGGPAAFGAQIHELTGKVIPAYQTDARRLESLYKDALKTHNKKLQDSLLKQLDAVTKATVQAYADLSQAQQDKVDAVVTKHKTDADKYQTQSDLATAIESLKPGSSTGLSAATMKRLGISPMAFAGGASYLTNVAKTRAFTAGDIAAMKTEDTAISQPLQKEKNADLAAINQLTGMLPSLTDPAAKAKAMDEIRTLSGSVVSLTDQINKATDVTQQEIDAINAQVAATQAVTTKQQSAADITSSIANLAPGTDLGAMGLSPAVLASLGINPATAAAIEGGGSAYISKLQGQQGGTLTSDQIATATAATAATNAQLSAEKGTDVGALAALETEIPNLTGDALTTGQQQASDLIKSILSLTDTINSNNDAVAALTKATNANTTATGQMTGSVAYSYQGQDFTASLSSDADINLGLGG